MKNIEKHLDELLALDAPFFAVTTEGKICLCNDIDCDMCIFNGENADFCNKCRIEWLFSEYVEPKPKLSVLARKILKKYYSLEYRYMAKDEDKDVCFYDQMPYKTSRGYWLNDDGRCDTLLDELAEEFSFLRWDDKEPTEIASLLEEDENAERD